MYDSGTLVAVTMLCNPKQNFAEKNGLIFQHCQVRKDYQKLLYLPCVIPRAWKTFDFLLYYTEKNPGLALRLSQEAGDGKKGVVAEKNKERRRYFQAWELMRKK